MKRTTNVRVNLEKLEPSRLKVRAGDIFALKPLGRPYHFGRVIRTDVPFWRGRMLLLYIYAASSDSLTEIPPLWRIELLVPPKLTNRLGWRHLHPVGSPTCSLLQRRVSTVLRRERDDPPKPIEPVGDYGLDSYRTIDDAVSQGLGIPRVPD